MILATLDDWLPLFIYALMAIAIPTSMVVASFALSTRPKNRTKARSGPFESGVSTGPPKQQRFTISFYLTAMLFILFDIEVVFLYPWAVVYIDMLSAPASANLIFGTMVSFLGILFIGYIYAIKKNAFDWES